MCGIVGWVDWERDLSGEREILNAMVQTLTARGPDASGTYMNGHVALGHRRLSVVDLEGGKQPMQRERGGCHYVITYNGELYNTPELKQELQARGHTFNTTSDTEVLLKSYIEWGPNCAERLNGIFAFGIWDEAEQRIFLARDRIGVKPLFYSVKDHVLLFGSELKALLANPLVKPQIDQEGLAEVFMIGPARTPGHGIYRGVNELKPGYSMTFDRNGFSIKRYWKLESHPHTDDFSTTASKVRELLIDTVKRQLVSDVPVCTFLSGGLDSSALTALTWASNVKKAGDRVDTYSVDYVDNDLFFTASKFQPNSDTPWVKRVAQYFGTRHHNVILDTPDLVDALPKATLSRDLPGMADVDTSLYLFCREIKKGATVALSGECADEVFGGYPWFYREDMLHAGTFPWAIMTPFRQSWLSPELYNYIRPTEYVIGRYQEALSEVPHLDGEDKEEARMREIFYLSLTRFMPTLLDRKDRMSMAFGLEVRVPFCDHRLVEYVWNVPWSFKNYQKREKGLLRYAMSGILPDDVLWRKKSPYPKTHNPSYLKKVRKWALAILEEGSSPLLPLVDMNRIREIAKLDDVAANIPWFGQLMTIAQFFAYLIQIDTWLREYKVEII